MSTTTTVAAVTSHAGALVTALVVLTGGASLSGGAAAADPNQDAQFLALLDQEQIPALKGVPSLIATAHKVCRKLDGGMTVDSLVDDMKDHALINPSWRGVPERRVISTVTRFITASVEAYCPGDQSKIVSIMDYAPPGPHTPTQAVSLRTRVLPQGDLAPDPPEIPVPPPPDAPTLVPPRPIAVPPPPKRSPPPPKKTPPPPKQSPPGTAGGGAGGPGGNEGGAPADPSPAPPLSPGWVRLAP